MYLIVVKFATKVKSFVITKVVSAFEEKTLSPSVQLAKLYPSSATAFMVTEASVSYVPSPVVVPPSSGLDDSATVCRPIVVKVQM